MYLKSPKSLNTLYSRQLLFEFKFEVDEMAVALTLYIFALVDGSSVQLKIKTPSTRTCPLVKPKNQSSQLSDHKSTSCGQKFNLVCADQTVELE